MCPGLSLPSRERGLKSCISRKSRARKAVAPFTGAWIEIGRLYHDHCDCQVAPFTGAWIEMTEGDLYDMADDGRSLHGSVD